MSFNQIGFERFIILGPRGGLGHSSATYQKLLQNAADLTCYPRVGRRSGAERALPLYYGLILSEADFGGAMLGGRLSKMCCSASSTFFTQ